MGSPLIVFALFCALHLNFVTAVEPDLMYLPDDDNGVAHLVSVDDFELSEQDILYLKANLSGINFLLYTRDNPTEGYSLILGDVHNLEKSNWNADYPTRIITHGWRSNGLSKSCTRIRNAYLNVGKFNVIVIDWKEIAGDILYSKVTACIPNVANYVTTFINYMQNFAGLDPRKTLMVGHSLGAHLVSLAARGVYDNIAEVVGLDPAGPGFNNKDSSNRIHESHADYVQVIHTNGGTLGFQKEAGSADFYMNGGQSQPGCSKWDVLGRCAHGRSHEYFAESILRQFSFRAIPANCSRNQSCPSVYMGGPYLDHKARGSYDITTASQSPYGLG